MLGYSLQDHQPDWDAVVRDTLPGIGDVQAAGEVTAGGAAHPVSDLAWGADECHKVSVIHLFMMFETEPSCRLVT